MGDGNAVLRRHLHALVAHRLAQCVGAGDDRDFSQLALLEVGEIFSQAILSVCGVLNTYFFTGSTIGMPPASEMKGLCLLEDGDIDIEVPVVVPPITAATLSSSTKRVANVRAAWASPPSS